MRLKRFKGKVRGKVGATGEALGAGVPGFRERLLALVVGARRRWEALSPEEREGLLSQAIALLSLLPLGRLGRWGLLLAKGVQLGARKEVRSLLRKLLKP